MEALSLITTLAAAGILAAAQPASQAAPPSTRYVYFATPSGNIVCAHVSGANGFMGCRIKSGLKPPSPRRKCVEGDFVNDRVFLSPTGRVKVQTCAGDPGIFVFEPARPRVLAYGKTWSGGGVSCTSAFTGLTCRNARGHGFFLSRERWRQF